MTQRPNLWSLLPLASALLSSRFSSLITIRSFSTALRSPLRTPSVIVRVRQFPAAMKRHRLPSPSSRRTRDFDESDEYCPKCDNHYYIEAMSGKEEQPQIMVAQSDDAQALKERMQVLTGGAAEVSSCR